MLLFFFFSKKNSNFFLFALSKLQQVVTQLQLCFRTAFDTFSFNQAPTDAIWSTRLTTKTTISNRFRPSSRATATF